MEKAKKAIKTKRPYRESDSFDEGLNSQQTNGTFTTPLRRLVRFGEERIDHDRDQSDEFSGDFDPSYEEEYRKERSRGTNFGKGPKGVHCSPEGIKNNASEILNRDLDLHASGILVDLEDSVLVLRGEVATRLEKRRAEWLLEELPGVEDILNLITIKKSNK